MALTERDQIPPPAADPLRPAMRVYRRSYVKSIVLLKCCKSSLMIYFRFIFYIFLYKRKRTICSVYEYDISASSNTLPNVLQKAMIDVISEGDCNIRLGPVTGASVGGGQICLYDVANNIGSCN